MGDARSALRDLAELYARGCDRRRPADVAALFVPDGRIAIFAGDPQAGGELRSELNGREAIERGLGRLSRYSATMHLLGQQHVDELDEDAGAAAAETYCMAHHLTDGTDRVMAIRYLDRFERSDGEWRFRERRLAVDWTVEVEVASA